MKKVNVKKLAFIVVDVVVALILMGAVIFGIFGFNKGTDLTNYVEVKVTLNDSYYLGDSKYTAQSDIENILEKNGYALAQDTYILTESEVYNVLVFSLKGGDKTYKKLISQETDSVYQQIKAYIETENPGYTFNDDENATEYRADLVGKTYSDSVMQKTLIAMAVVLGVMLVYFLIRFRVASTIASLLASILEFCLFNAVVILTRIPISGLYPIVLFAVLGLSLIAGLIYNAIYREELKNPKEMEMIERANVVSCKGLKVVGGVFAAIIIGLLIAIIIVPATIKLTFALVALGTLLVGACAVLVRPTLRYWLSLIKFNKKTGYSVHAKQKENKD